ncbi:helix-turn-helix domain-containing protein [Endozoicomonas ascidiicola]|uniref:helix-turn-helix domain-containing protein n=1 Tax=Endozoicomonas ascidiicola TaxID=1698521 RepID=UPI000837980C|nr:helix-turn-helix domain-containing protein [Endozoicomonas ascidiicola]
MNWKQRTKELLAERGMSQSDLSRALGVTRATISLWLGESSSYTDYNVAKIQYKLAAALDVPKDYLAKGNDINKPQGRGVPVLPYEAIGRWLDESICDENTTLMFCPVRCSPMSYALKVRGSAMDSQGRSGASFPADNMIYVDPKLPLKEGNICILEDKEIMLGIYERVNGQDTVVFLNANSPRLQVESLKYHGTVIGTFTEVRQY